MLTETILFVSQKWQYVETSNVVEVCTFSTALIAPLAETIGLHPSYKYVFLVISVLFGYLTLLLYLQRLAGSITFTIFKQ